MWLPKFTDSKDPRHRNSGLRKTDERDSRGNQ